MLPQQYPGNIVLSVLLAVLFLAPVGAGAAVLQPTGENCAVLYAGQTTEAGEVCVELTGETLLVVFSTKDGWELTEAHLWLGDDLANMPQTHTGNPKVGNFPYNSGEITGATEYVFNIPRSELDIPVGFCEAGVGGYDSVVLIVAAHAALRKDNGDGTYQTETGWGGEDPITEKGNWATYFTVVLECNEDPNGEGSCETAFGFGDTELDDFLNTSRWGWQITVNEGDSFTTPIYAGAGQNDISKGIAVGMLTVVYDGSNVSITYSMYSGYVLNETHVYAGDAYSQTAAPGFYGNMHEDLPGVSSDTYTIAVTGNPIYIIAHARVCGFTTAN